MMYLDNRRQKACETVLECQEELRKLAFLAYPYLNNTSRENIIRPIFIRGLQPSIKDVLKFREFSSFTEAVKTAKFVESQIFRDSMSAPMMNMMVTSEQVADFPRQELKQLIIEAIGEMQNKKSCFICGSVFHLKRNCPEKKRKVTWGASNGGYGKRSRFGRFNPDRATTPYAWAPSQHSEQVVNQQTFGEHFASNSIHKICDRKETHKNRWNFVKTSDNDDDCVKYHASHDLIANIFAGEPTGVHYEPIKPAVSEKAVTWYTMETDRITKKLAENDLQEDVIMKKLFGPLDPMFDVDIDLEADDAPGPSHTGFSKIKVARRNLFDFSVKADNMKSTGSGACETKDDKKARMIAIIFQYILSLFVVIRALIVNRESGPVIIISHGKKHMCSHEWAKYSETPPDTRDKTPYLIEMKNWKSQGWMIHTPVNRGKKFTKRERI